MQVKIKRIDKNFEYPQYQTNGAVGFDLVTREDATIMPGEIALIPTNVVIEVPEGYMLMVALRSSAPKKWNVTIPQGVGIVDQDYCGPDDEIFLQVLNFHERSLTHIPAGTRLAQGVFVKVGIVTEWKEVAEMTNETRGGFGSTG